jgi:uncharacterized phage protein gp47/JayE
MQLQLRTFSSLVSSAAAAVQGSAKQLLDLTTGSTLRAVLEANASLALWLQWLILQVLQTTRASTSTGADLDSWMADFSLTRLAAVPATGVVTFARFVPTSAALVPVGAIVRTADGTQSFTVVVNTALSAWSVSQNGYALAAGISSVDVPVVAANAGSAGNVQAGAITLMASALPGVDTVTNAAPLQGGLDAESDAALRTRFATFLATRSRATPLAVGNAITSLRQGLQYTIQENVAPDGSARMGCFVVTVDDGSGAPAASLIASAAAAVEAVRPVGATYTVQPPTVVQTQISMTIATASGAMHTDVAAQVAAVVTSYVNALPIGATLAWSRLAQVAYDASANVTNVTGVLLSGGTADLAPGAGGVVKASSVQVA